MSGNGYDFATWLICDGEYPCTSISSGFDSSGGYDAYGGTSTAAPAFAGILALVQQKTGSRLGQAAQTLYALYNGSHAGSVFHDVTVGNNSVPCTSGTPNCALDSESDYFESGYNALTGYDLASGMGSVDATQLINYWSTANGTATATVALTLTPSSGSITAAQSLSVKVSVTGTSTTPTGNVTLSGGGYLSSVVALSASGSAGVYTFTIPAGDLATGTDTLTAIYNGDASNSTYGIATGTATVIVTTSSSTTTFVVNSPIPVVSPTTIAPGSTSTATITVSSANGYAGTVTLTCVLTSPTNLTDPPTCSGGSSTVTLNSTTTSGTATITVYTTAASSAALVYPKLPGKGHGLFGAGSGALLAILLFFGIPARRRSWRSMLGILMLMAALGTLSACGSGTATTTQSNPGTSAGTYSFTVTGTGNDTNKTTATVTFQVIVS
jgi:hypothetical protein